MRGRVDIKALELFPDQRISFPVFSNKFPVPLFREFGNKAAQYVRFQGWVRQNRGRIRKSSLYFPCLTGKSPPDHQRRVRPGLRPPPLTRGVFSHPSANGDEWRITAAFGRYLPVVCGQGTVPGDPLGRNCRNVFDRRCVTPGHEPDGCDPRRSRTREPRNLPMDGAQIKQFIRTDFWGAGQIYKTPRIR